MNKIFFVLIVALFSLNACAGSRVEYSKSVGRSGRGVHKYIKVNYYFTVDGEYFDGGTVRRGSENLKLHLEIFNSGDYYKIFDSREGVLEDNIFGREYLNVFVFPLKDYKKGKTIKKTTFILSGPDVITIPITFRIP